MIFLQNIKNQCIDLAKTLLVIGCIAFFMRTFLYGLYQVPSGSMETTMLVGEGFVADKCTPWFYSPERGDIISFNDAWQYTYSENRFMRLFQQYIWGPSNWTKRVIGVPGDHVQGVIEEGQPVIYINGEKLHEPYVNKYPLIAVYDDRSSDNDRYHMRSFDPQFAFEEQPFYILNPHNVYQAKEFFARMARPSILIPHTPVHARQGERSPDIFDIKLHDTQYWVMGDNRLGSGDSRFYGPLDACHIHGRIVFRLWSIDSQESWWIVDLLKHPLDFWKRVRWSRFFQKLY